MAATHVSYPDFVFIEKAAIGRGRYVRFMTRHDIWHQRVLAGPMSRMKHIPVDREAPAAAYLMARRLLREGEAVCGFPEAGISYSYTVRSLMRGHGQPGAGDRGAGDPRGAVGQPADLQRRPAKRRRQGATTRPHPGVGSWTSASVSRWRSRPARTSASGLGASALA